MTTTEAKSAARARIRAFLDARNSYAASLPLGAAQYAMTDEITRQAPDGGEQAGPFSNVDEFFAARQATTMPLLASDLALLAADEDEARPEPNPGDPDCQHGRLSLFADSGASRCLDCPAAFAPPPMDAYGNTITLPNEDFDALTGSLEEPAAAVPELVNLFRRNRVTPTGEEG